jgi:uncharacterized protein (DUF4213/DUF364 family)
VTKAVRPAPTKKDEILAKRPPPPPPDGFGGAGFNVSAVAKVLRTWKHYKINNAVEQVFSSQSSKQAAKLLATTGRLRNVKKSFPVYITERVCRTLVKANLDDATYKVDLLLNADNIIFFGGGVQW